MSKREIEIGAVGKVVAEQVGKYRRERGLTQVQLQQATASNGRELSAATIGDIERAARRVDVDDLVVLADSLGVSVDALLTSDRAAALLLDLSESEIQVRVAQAVEDLLPGRLAEIDARYEARHDAFVARVERMIREGDDGNN